MRNRLAISVALLGFGGAVVAVALMLNDYVRADVLGGPLPAPSPPPDTIQLTPVEKLGKLMLYDSTLSNPPGYSCATCHVAGRQFLGWPRFRPRQARAATAHQSQRDGEHS